MSELVYPSISVSRDIPAPAGEIFALLAKPAMHPLIDGTGMARSADESFVITKVGDVFVMHMTHWSLGNYGMENHVIEFEPERRIVWEPRVHTYQESEFPGDPNVPETRYWGWELEPLGTNLTRVTEFYDASRLSTSLREFLKDGEFWRKGMNESLANLERLVTTSTTSDQTPKRDATQQGAARSKNYYEEVRGQN